MKLCSLSYLVYSVTEDLSLLIKMSSSKLHTAPLTGCSGLPYIHAILYEEHELSDIRRSLNAAAAAVLWASHTSSHITSNQPPPAAAASHPHSGEHWGKATTERASWSGHFPSYRWARFYFCSRNVNATCVEAAALCWMTVGCVYRLPGCRIDSTNVQLHVGMLWCCNRMPPPPRNYHE